uniref:Uncharacterized protein n=1 Tax=Heterosigma akashiwo TaxID=2829 RepID=A0A7S4D6F2_HETAK
MGASPSCIMLPTTGTSYVAELTQQQPNRSEIYLHKSLSSRKKGVKTGARGTQTCRSTSRPNEPKIIQVFSRNKGLHDEVSDSFENVEHSSPGALVTWSLAMIRRERNKTTYQERLSYLSSFDTSNTKTAYVSLFDYFFEEMEVNSARAAAAIFGSSLKERAKTFGVFVNSISEALNYNKSKFRPFFRSEPEFVQLMLERKESLDASVIGKFYCIEDALIASLCMVIPDVLTESYSVTVTAALKAWTRGARLLLQRVHIAYFPNADRHSYSIMSPAERWKQRKNTPSSFRGMFSSPSVTITEKKQPSVLARTMTNTGTF